MGVNLKKIVDSKKISFDILNGKKIAIDAFNTLYQFITTIRQYDGTPLMNHEGKITSHLSGLLYRTSKMVEAGVLPCYVFDGKPPEFKLVLGERKQRKKEALEKLKKAKKEGNEDAMKTYASQASKLEDYMIEDAKLLLTYLGIPWIQAPSEGEAQAAYMAKKGDVWAVGSQDMDALLFGAPKLVRNMTISGRRKLPGKNIYVNVVPELIEKSQINFSQKELIVVGLLVGTDFNPHGIKGIGPVGAKKLVEEYGVDAINEVEWKEEWPSPKTLIDFFTKPPKTNDYKLSWKNPDWDAALDFLVSKNDFSEKRVGKALNPFKQSLKKGKQTGLDDWC